jgi:ATP-binding cassette subfamily B multidrug efflux pump
MFNWLFSWFENCVDSFPPAEAQKPEERLLPFVWFYTRPFLPLLIADVLFSFTIAVIEIYFYGFVGGLVDLLSNASRETFWQDHGWYLAFMGALALIIQPAINFVGETSSHQGLRGNFAMRTRWLAHRYVLRQSMEYFQNDFAGRLATKVMQAALGVRDAVMKVTDVVVYVLVYFVGAMFLLATADWRLMIPLAVWLMGYGLTCLYFVPKLEKQASAQADMRSLVTGRIVDSYTNISTVKLFAHAEREEAFAREGMQWMLDAVYKSMRTSSLMAGTLSALNGVLVTSMTGLSIWLWYVNAVSPGAIAIAMALALRFRAMSQWIIWELAGLFEDIGTVRDSMETIARDRTVVDKPAALPLKVSEGRVEFRDVSFNYHKPVASGAAMALDNLSLTVNPGEKVGLVGRSGAGKSTLTSLLLRFYDVERGGILIDGQNIADVSQESLRSSIGVVTQDTSLLHRSVLDNLRYGKPDASMAEVEAAARKAHAEEFIARLIDPKGRTGYEAHVGERGVKLSGGQRQRIAIARVLLKNAPILVLDEATSALDSEVEAAIQENLYALMEGKTVIAVAHRLSTIAAMDRLLVMDEGRIVEQGSHKQLLRKNGLYASLWNRQSGGFLADQAAKAAE